MGDLDGDGYSEVAIICSLGRSYYYDTVGFLYLYSGAALAGGGQLGPEDATWVWADPSNNLEEPGGRSHYGIPGDMNGDGLDDLLMGVAWHPNNLVVDGDVLLASTERGVAVTEVSTTGLQSLEDAYAFPPRQMRGNMTAPDQAQLLFRGLERTSLDWALQIIDVAAVEKDSTATIGELAAAEIVTNDYQAITYSPHGVLGDFDADGLDDIYVGTTACSSADGELTVELALSVVYGASLAGTATLDLADADLNLCNTGGRWSSYDQITGVGDLDGDGYAEVVYGGPYEQPYGIEGAGEAWLFRGGSWHSEGWGEFDDADVRWIGEWEYELFGGAVTAAADQDEDGRPELLVAGGFDPTATYGGHLGGWSGAGLPASGVLRPEDADVRFYAYTNPNDFPFGFAAWMAADQDVNGDGKADLALTGNGTLILFDWWNPDAWPDE